MRFRNGLHLTFGIILCLWNIRSSHNWMQSWEASLCPIGSKFDFPCPSTIGYGEQAQCIPSSWLCDEEPDCPEGEDEGKGPDEPCHNVTSDVCEADQFLCKSERLCISSVWKCDGDLDCDDGSDEHADNCPHLQHIFPCTPNQYQCPGSHKCIPYSQVCDNHFDCDSGTDEYQCSRPCKENVDCFQCVDRDGAVCYCDDGYQWNGKDCVDLNECYYDQYCDQMKRCTNSEGSFTCTCADGYTLQNKTRCIAVNEPVNKQGTLIIANNWDFRQLGMDGKRMEPSFIRQGQRITTIDFDFKNKTICWINYDGSTGHSSLLCSSSDDLEAPVKEIKVKVHLSTVDSFAYDWIHGNWYFTDPVLKRIVVCSHTTEFCSVILGGEQANQLLFGPRDLVLDPINGYLYFSDVSVSEDHPNYIMKCNLNGSYLEKFISKKILKPAGLAIDHANGHFYWSDTELNMIERIDLDGNETSKVVIAIGTKVEHIHSLDILDNFLYLSDAHEKQILKMHRYDYGVPVQPLLGNLSRPGQIRILHKQKQPQIDKNPCDDADCQHICTSFFIDGTRKASCLCGAGFQMENEMCQALDACTDICDGTNDCDKELMPEICTLDLCSKNRSFCAESMECLPTSWWCDGRVDCAGGEDEGLYCKYQECSLGTEFQCGTGNCVDFGLRCNRFDDCGDGTDEVGCEYPCDGENQFQCPEDPSHCIHEMFVCDGHPDCHNGSDEDPSHCNRGPQFDCQPGLEYRCRNGDCITMAWKCDGDEDCSDGSDEWEGDVCKKNGSSLCQANERPCDTGKRCIPSQWFCDGEPDCLDRSDENGKYCSNQTVYKCPHPNVRCEKDSVIRLCLKPQQLCDGINDCDGKIDEGGMCEDKVCQANNPCKNGECHNTPISPGFVCTCPANKKLDSDNVTCVNAVPFDKLCDQWGICGQNCTLTNKTAGYQCTCFDGFFLEPDKFTCKPLESEPIHIVFSNRHELRLVDIMSSNAISLVSGLKNTIALDFYYKDGYAVLFWTDVMEDKIYTGTIKGNNLVDVEPIITSGLATTEGVAVDWVAENIYWVESSLDQIEVAKLDGSNRTTLIAGSMRSPRAIVLDPRDGKLFWTDWDDQNPRIEGCSMSGDERKVIHEIKLSEGGGWPNGLAIDYDFRRLYWIDAKSESIHTINYEGDDLRLVLKSHKDMTHPFAMSLFGNYVYWTDWSTNSVVRANKFNGSGVEAVQKTVTQPFDLQVIHPKRQPVATNPCATNNGGCSDLCLINIGGTVGCRCPHRKRLNSDNKTCVDDVKFMLFVKNQEIRGVDLEKADFNVIPVITIPNIDQPQAIDYDPDNDTLYWIDNGLKVINRAYFNGTVITLIDKGLDNAEALAIDWLSRNMYFSSYNSDTNTASISVATLQGTYRTELIKTNISKPNSLALDPHGGNMYFTDKGGDGGNHRLLRAQLDGGLPVVLLNNLNQPKSLTFDQGRLYFINMGDNTIVTCDTDGKDRKIITNPSIVKPTSLTVYLDVIYISDDDKIVSVSKADGGDYTVIRETTPNVNALLIYDEQQRARKGENPCHNNKSGCSQLCLPTSKSLNMCKCTAGYDLIGTDNKICQGIQKFLLYAKETEIRGQKFTQSTTEALVPISQIQSATAIDFLAAHDYIYWVDQKTNSISRIKRDSTERAVIIKDGIYSVEGLALDWIAGHIYWTDAGHSTIEVSKVDGTNRSVIASGSMEKPRSIVVHPELGYLYWSDWGAEPKIERAHLDGSNRHLYIYSDMMSPWGLTIDYETHVLYWCDSGLKTIERVDLLTSGSYDRQILIDLKKDGKNHKPISLTVFGDNIYWIDSLDGGSIYSADKTTGANLTKLRGKLGMDLKDIKSYDVSRQSGTNMCQNNNGGCKELCFYLGNQKVRCACSYGKLDTDNQSCKEYEGFLMFSKVTEMDSINLYDSDNKNPPVEPIKNDTFLRNVIGLTFDYKTKRIFYSDIQRGDIQFVSFDGTNIMVVVDGIGSAEGLAFAKGKLYWTSYTNSCISSIDVEGVLANRSMKPQVVIQMSKMDHPRAIVADSCWELIYWTNWNSEKPRIQRSTLEGINPTDVITKDIVTPNGLAIDHIGKKLYWSDARLDKIERCDMDGSNRVVIITAIPHHSFGLAIYGNYLYWTDWMLRAVVRANKYDGTGIVWLRKNLERQPMGIIAVANDSNDCTINRCHNYECTDKCYTDEMGQPFCQCTYGRLKADGKSCALKTECDPRTLGYIPFTCQNNGFCIHYYQSCNGVPDCADGSDESPAVCANRDCPPTMFSCSNRTQGQCIPMSKKCDLTLDCKDGSDESYEFCQCPPGHFLCKSKECIPKTYRCDGNGDCEDNSDEIGCDSFTCEEGERKCSTYNDCIPNNKWCDGNPDCFDRSDEDNSTCQRTEPLTCDENSFRCNDGHCIYKAWYCDTDEDCADGSDEVNCTHTCKDGFIMCQDDKQCISAHWKCDRNEDCEDGSDELDCNQHNCTDSQYNCSSTGRCISKSWLCDGELDCQDGEDESSAVGCDPVTCYHDEFECANYQCIDKEYYCDNDDDCGDGSDEPDTCVYSHKCLETQFNCDEGYCINKELRCNGEPDCADASDEKDCDSGPIPCNNSTLFKCDNGVCLIDDLVCNGRNDCGDNSDEPGNCGIDECSKLLLHSCSQICEDKKIGYKCSCHEGFKLDTDNSTCIDLDECSTTYPCDQYCYNLHGSYYCECAEHYELAMDQHHCHLTNDAGKPYLLVSNRFYIRKVDLDGNDTILVKDLTHSVAIDFDYQTKTLFWTDIHSQSSTINSIVMDSPDAQPKELHSSTVLNPDGIAVDWVGRNLYWCDRNTDTVEVSKLDGKYRKIIVRNKTFLREPRALEIFPKYGYLYLTDWGNEPHISRISMDGSMFEHIITEEIAWPNALTIDYVSEKLFWADANFDYIAMADLDGKNRHVIVHDDLPHTFAITTFMERLYWTDWETNSIFSVEKFSGKKRTKLITMTHRPMDLVVYHNMRQPPLSPNPCDALNCSHLCLLRPSNVTGKVEAICACPEHHTMDEANKNCTAECSKSQFLCVSSSKCIPSWWVCDNHTDCDDGSDEHDQCGPHYCSHPGLFQCSNATSEKDCIPPIGICDGTPQCADGSDEAYMNNCSDYTCMTHQFQCPGNNICIGESKLCDHNHDCPGREDEANCDATKCQDTHFKCNSTSNCIPYLWQCDGDNDCPDGSDEASCDNRTCKEDFIKCEKTHKCIPAAWKCDGEHDCGANDDTDEKQELCAEVTCDPTYFKCGNSHCVPGRWKCDDDEDCSDGSDELNCDPKNCTDVEFKCTNNNRCVPNSAVCDGKFDCRDNSDEDQNCQHVTQCSKDQFRCLRGTIKCVPSTWKCDGEEDCMDGSDETDCTADCHPSEFRCKKSTKCLPAQWRCDSERDCADGSDETGCKNYACLTGRFRCLEHTCIPMHKRCDGVKDCADGYDELCAKSTMNCDGYRCMNKQTCIKTSQVCDGTPDCGDGDDELQAVCESGLNCTLYQMICGMNSVCVYYQNISLTSCRCDVGYKLSDNNDCVRHDPCMDWSTCSQHCEQIKGTEYHCSCQEKGYQYSPEKNTCIAKGDSKPILMMIEEDQIIEQAPTYSWEEKGNRSIGANETKITAVDIDITSPNMADWMMFMVVKEQKLIKSQKIVIPGWMDGNDVTVRRRRSAPVNNADVKVVIRHLSQPTDIAVDWIGKHLYWTDMGLKRIQMCKYDGGKYRTVIKDGLNKPFAIVVDPNEGKIFWTDVGYPPRIESAHLDGSNRRSLVALNVIWPNGLAIDFPNRRLYWTDTKSHTVETTWLDGSDRRIVRKFDAEDPPYKVDVFEDYLYVTTHKKHQVLRFHKFYDKKENNSTTVLRPSAPFIGDVLIYHPSKQLVGGPDVNQCAKDPCAASKSMLCINNPVNSTRKKYTCVCPDGADYDPAYKACSFKPCPSHHCRNNGTCITIRDEFKCSCPEGFMGKQCEIDPCENYCPNGICSVVNGSQPTCVCNKGFNGEKCDQYVCSGYCKNLGICQLKDDGKPRCVCLDGYMGPQCEEIVQQTCDDYCLNGGSCTINKENGHRSCSCPSEFTGTRCEQCGLQHSIHLCYNGGVCTISDKKAMCKCPPGYDPRTHCKQRTCSGYCMNEALCTINGDFITCACKAGFEGPRCMTYVDQCNNTYCRNNGTCVLNNAVPNNSSQKKATCNCPPGFFGSYCENELRRCIKFCQNGGNCTFSNGDPYCTCPNVYNGKVCENCLCVNGECSKQGKGQPTCLCNDLYDGPYCNKSICHDYCFNNGLCERCERNPHTQIGTCQKCKCTDRFTGIRCQTPVKATQPPATVASSYIPVVVPIVIILIVVLAILIFIIVKKKRSAQFRHSRLKDGNNLNVSNPIYMPQTTEDEEMDDSRQPLDQPYEFDPEKATNFSNPVFDQFFSNDSKQQLLPKEDSDDEVEVTKETGKR